MPLTDIDTIIFVMLENRSFDQMLGYLSLDETETKLPVDGLRSSKDWQDPYANLADGKRYPLKKVAGSQPIDQDPPHGRESINTQILLAPVGPGVTKMGGFVETYLGAHGAPADPGVVMGYYDGKDVPTYDFLAHNFCVCDMWFTPLPLGTQANRLMAMAGETLVVDNVTGLPHQKLIYDWLDEKRVSWGVYISGGFTPFFIMMRQWTLKIVRSLAFGGGRFHRFSAFRDHWRSKEPVPSIIFIEPEYADAPMSDPNDDHPPAPISKGQDLVRDIYEIVTSNPARWQKTLMIVTYDEHGGFFDHVPPLEILTRIDDVTLATTGPRVPALLISPHVGAGEVFNEPLDHTSFLQLISERFDGGRDFSEAVARRQTVLGRISNALIAEARGEKAPAMPPRPRRTGVRTMQAPPTAPDTPNAAAIDAIMREMAKEHPELINQPGWSQMRVYLETNPRPVPIHRDDIGDAKDL